MKTAKEILIEGVQQLGISFDVDKGMQYIALLAKWNKSFNLTAITNENEMVIKHLLDCLAIVPYIKGKRVLDVGSGAGLPGLIIALCLPDVLVTLLDCSLKRVRFLEQAALYLKLPNVLPIHSRIEKYQPDEAYDVITSRAFTNLYQFVALTKHLKATDGVILAMKGKLDDDEKNALHDLPFEEIQLHVPFLQGQRHLIRIR